MIDDARKKWALAQIDMLEEHREVMIFETDAKIAELRRFVEMLEIAKSAIEGQKPVGSDTAESHSDNGSEQVTVPDRIARVLASAGPRGLAIAEVVERLRAEGFEYRGKVPVATMLSAELARQHRIGTRGIKRVGPGRYALRPKSWSFRNNVSLRSRAPAVVR